MYTQLSSEILMKNINMSPSNTMIMKPLITIHTSPMIITQILNMSISKNIPINLPKTSMATNNRSTRNMAAVIITTKNHIVIFAKLFHHKFMKTKNSFPVKIKSKSSPTIRCNCWNFSFLCYKNTSIRYGHPCICFQSKKFRVFCCCSLLFVVILRYLLIITIKKKIWIMYCELFEKTTAPIIKLLLKILMIYFFVLIYLWPYQISIVTTTYFSVIKLWNSINYKNIKF